MQKFKVSLFIGLIALTFVTHISYAFINSFCDNTDPEQVCEDESTPAPTPYQYYQDVSCSRLGSGWVDDGRGDCTKNCGNGSWIYEGQSCPSAPAPAPQAPTPAPYQYYQDVSCSRFGSGWVDDGRGDCTKNCGNGSWIYEGQSCPTAPTPVAPIQQPVRQVVQTPSYQAYSAPQAQPQAPVVTGFWVIPSTPVAPSAPQAPSYNNSWYNTAPQQPQVVQQVIQPQQVQTQRCWNNSVIPVNQACPVETRFCSLNGATYPVNIFTQSCTKYCVHTNYSYASQGEYDALCRAPASLFCALNQQNYQDQNSYAANCKKYCDINRYYYSTLSEYDAYCRAPVVQQVIVQPQPIVQQQVVQQPAPAPYISTNWYNTAPQQPQIVQQVVAQPQQVQTQRCWDNSVIPVNQACPVQQVIVQPQPQQPIVQQPAPAPYISTNWYNTAPQQPQVVQQQVVQQPQQVVQQITCPQYFVNQNNQCVQTQKMCQSGQVISISQTCYKVCSGGTGQVPENQVCPAQTQTCPNGSVILVSEICPPQMKTCQSGQSVPVSQTCTKQCPNGAIISELSTCPAQTKTCKNGNVIALNQECTKQCPNGNVINEDYSCPAPVINHSVVTTIPTSISKDSGRCNGVAVISNNVNSIGYFEYGTTQNLGQNTNQANIGSDRSVSFSNLISGLSPGTTYYCRAVITNANGTYKGSIQQFRTANEETRYVPQIQTVTTVVKKEEVIVRTPVVSVVNNKKVITEKVEKKIVEVKAATKKVVICKDESGNKSDLAPGAKFVDIEIIKNTTPVAGKNISYIAKYKNNSNINLKNAYVKMSIPESYNYIGSIGTIKDSDIIVNIGDIKAGETIEKSFDFKVKSDAKVGTSVVSSAYVYYEMLDENGKEVSDENSSYVIATVAEKSVSSNSSPNTDNSNKNNSANTSNGSTESVWGGSIFRWLVMFVLFGILVILGRTIYKAYLHRKYGNHVLGAHH